MDLTRTVRSAVLTQVVVETAVAQDQLVSTLMLTELSPSVEVQEMEEAALTMLAQQVTTGTKRPACASQRFNAQ
jgi:hypothetical protein